MSIIIKGMEMPNAGIYSCLLSVLDENTATLTIYTPIEEPQPSYNLVAIPPHGRLIDADELVEQINQSIAEQEKVFDSIKEDPIGKQSIWVDIMHDERIVRILRDATTIIEAEEAKEK